MQADVVPVPAEMFERMVHFLTIYYLAYRDDSPELKELVHKLNQIDNGIDPDSKTGDGAVDVLLSDKDENV